MLRLLAAAAVLLGSVTPAQVTSYTSNNPPPVDGDQHKIVCKKEEKIGTRLGAKKVCLTVAEWSERTRAHQERTERIQMGTCQAGEGQSCFDPN